MKEKRVRRHRPVLDKMGKGAIITLATIEQIIEAETKTAEPFEVGLHGQSIPDEIELRHPNTGKALQPG